MARPEVVTDEGTGLGRVVGAAHRAARRWPEWNKVRSASRQGRPLGLAVVTVFPPFGGVGVDIVPDAEIVRLAADDVVVVGRLPKIEPRKLISKSF